MNLYHKSRLRYRSAWRNLTLLGIEIGLHLAPCAAWKSTSNALKSSAKLLVAGVAKQYLAVAASSAVLLSGDDMVKTRRSRRGERTKPPRRLNKTAIDALKPEAEP